MAGSPRSAQAGLSGVAMGDPCFFGSEARVLLAQGFGVRVRELRVAAGLTPDELCARCGTVGSAISKIERGRPEPPSVADRSGVPRTRRVPGHASRGSGRSATSQAAPEEKVVMGCSSFPCRRVRGNWRLVGRLEAVAAACGRRGVKQDCIGGTAA